MKYFIFCLIAVLAITVCAEDEALYIDTVTVKHISGLKYNITVSGNAPTPGYTNIRLVPRTYFGAPESWEFDVMATPPSGGMMIQMLKPYTVSLEHTFSSGVSGITIVGRSRQLTKKLKVVSKPKAPEALYVDKVTVKHISGRKYNITVSGNAPTPGYTNIRLIPRTYFAAPESWEFDVMATPPSGGMMIQMLKPYTVSLEHTFSRGVKSLTVVGRARQVTKKLKADKPKEVLEQLYGINVGKDNIDFMVMSTGCTKKEDFIVKVNHPKKHHVVALYRVNPDVCRARAHIVKISFTKKELGLDGVSAFKVKNIFSFSFFK